MVRRWAAGGAWLISASVFGQDAPVFEHITIDVENRIVEIDGVVPIDCHDEETPDVYLEVIACTPGTKEHEALVLTRAKPSQVHAALLAIGLEPGKPGSWTWDGESLTANQPEGPKVRVEIEYTNDKGETIACDARDWIVSVKDQSPFGSDAAWLFAGSRMVTFQEREVYDADGTGLLVGLTTFGSETIAWGEVISHEAEIAEPVWIANRELVPAFKTPVKLRLSAAEPVETPAASPTSDRACSASRASAWSWNPRW